MKELKQSIASIGKRIAGPGKSQESKESDPCPYCGARSNVSHPSSMSIREMAVSGVSIMLVLVILVPTWSLAERWLDRQSQRVLDRMIWRGPAENW
jgi:hypothetical protein